MKYIEGDIFKLAESGMFDYVVHGCNIYNTMGSGIAKTVAEQYPQARAVDLLTQRGDPNKLGKFTKAYIDTKIASKGPQVRGLKKISESFTIINAYTQTKFWDTGTPNVDYIAILSAFTSIKLAFDMNVQAPARIGIPKIGAGLAGGDWDKIEKIIDSVGFSDLTCVIYKGD